MKRMILVAIAIAAVAVPAFALTMHGHQQGVNNIVCSLCKGTGRSHGPNGPGTGQFKCPWCKGSGFNGSY